MSPPHSPQHPRQVKNDSIHIKLFHFETYESWKKLKQNTNKGETISKCEEEIHKKRKRRKEKSQGEIFGVKQKKKNQIFEEKGEPNTNRRTKPCINVGEKY